MKTATAMFLCVLAWIVRMDFAGAAVITVNVTGHVMNLNDGTGLLTGQVFAGQAITASYTYDTNTSPTNPQWYQPSMPPASASVTIGQLLFQSVAPSQPGFPNQAPFSVYINLPGTPGIPSMLSVTSYSNQLLKSGTPLAPVDQIAFNFLDMTGQWPADTTLPAGAPALASLATSAILIQGGPGANFNVMIQIDSVALVPPTFEVSPASGDFVGPQRFDAALLVPGSVQIASAQASVGGNPVPYLSYPGQCTLVFLPPFISRTALVCPNASQVLFPQGGPPTPTTVNWQVILTDGTVMNQTVTWNLVF